MYGELSVFFKYGIFPPIEAILITGDMYMKNVKTLPAVKKVYAGNGVKLEALLKAYMEREARKL